MKLKGALVVGLMAASATLVPVSSLAGFVTLYGNITSPQDGDRFATHDRIRVWWNVRCYGEVPTHPIHFMVRLDGVWLTYDYYDDIRPDNPGQVPTYFTMYGYYTYMVPGNAYAKIPNAVLEVWSGDDNVPIEYDWTGNVTIGIKTWYDPLPIPVVESSTAVDTEGTQEATTWSRIKSLYSAP